jgi:hypothetical protein
LVNIFKEAKEAYSEKKAALHAEHHRKTRDNSEQKLMRAREETRSVTSSRHSRSSHRSHRHGDGHRDKDRGKGVSRPPLTERNLSMASEGSVASGRSKRSRRSSSHRGERHTPRSPTLPLASPSGYRAPFFENADISQPSLVRRHTDMPHAPTASSISHGGTLPPPYKSQVTRRSSVPDLHAPEEENIDMNLAYGTLPPDLSASGVPLQKEQEIVATMSKLDSLLLEAECLQHSATAIIANLQANPEAMAAVALTLAELSTLLAKMSPGIIAALKGSSPAIFALLASPQFLIASGVAIGVTVVMFGGFKIIKKIQASAAATKEANRMDEALVYDGAELSSIDTWRRGIAEVEAQSVATSVDGEFITPEAMRQKKERIRERAREERIDEERSVRSERTLRRAGSESTIRQREVPVRSPSSRVGPSESGRTSSNLEPSESSRSTKGKERDVLMLTEGDRKLKKSSTFSVLFRKKKDKEGKRESELSHRPKFLDL